MVSGTSIQAFWLAGDVSVGRVDSTGVAEGTAYRGDTAWGLVKLTGDKLLVIGAQVAPGRTDTDFAVVRLNADVIRGDARAAMASSISSRRSSVAPCAGMRFQNTLEGRGSA